MFSYPRRNNQHIPNPNLLHMHHLLSSKHIENWNISRSLHTDWFFRTRPKQSQNYDTPYFHLCRCLYNYIPLVSNWQQLGKLLDRTNKKIQQIISDLYQLITLISNININLLTTCWLSWCALLYRIGVLRKNSVNEK